MAHEDITQIKSIEKMNFNFGFQDIDSQKSWEDSFLNFCDYNLYLACSFDVFTMKVRKHGHWITFDQSQ